MWTTNNPGAFWGHHTQCLATCRAAQQACWRARTGTSARESRTRKARSYVCCPKMLLSKDGHARRWAA